MTSRLDLVCEAVEIVGCMFFGFRLFSLPMGHNMSEVEDNDCFLLLSMDFESEIEDNSLELDLVELGLVFDLVDLVEIGFILDLVEFEIYFFVLVPLTWISRWHLHANPPFSLNRCYFLILEFAVVTTFRMSRCNVVVDEVVFLKNYYIDVCDNPIYRVPRFCNIYIQ